MQIQRVQLTRRLTHRQVSRTLRINTVRASANGREAAPTVRVKFSVHYRAHRHQILCIGGSQLPLGWSFLSIAKMPMAWNPDDKWTCEVEFAAGQRIEYKYVVLEEQEWTNLADKYAQGYVEVPYRTAADPGRPPDPREIVAMAIVAWQPGPNRVLQVPSEDEIKRLNSTSGPVQRERTYNTAEWIRFDESAKPLLIRDDVWGWP
ncbi:hypothetical protein Agub_g2473 [Astrephomene gubernaculifera]|uniref:CBM20 domain-containing protein n=1 Tax=Astrephomene gubernaculifera TaxID=47775 RepID=A0AAD3HI47_9CHLO|nr:hypothetical protein Agub_g2473 [Astrephomene gubernaculifera]